MNGYKAFHKGKEIELEAESSFEAQQKAAIVFKARKSYEVSVLLCRLGKNGSTVVNVPDF